MREDAVTGREQGGSVVADAQAAIDVVVVDGLRLLQEHRGHGGRRGVRAAGGERRLPGSPHLVQRPAEVDGRGARDQQAARGPLESFPERGRVVGPCRRGRRGRERDAAGLPAVTPIAGAPRTVMSLMRSATSCQVRQVTNAPPAAVRADR